MNHGFMTELVVDEEQYLNVVPAELREIAVLTEPLTIAEKALTQIWQVQERLPWARPNRSGDQPVYCHRAVVLGAGPVGLLGAMALVNAGFQTFVYSRGPSGSKESDVTRGIGATYISSQEATVQQLAEKVGQIDIVYEATGASQLSFEVIKFIGTNAVFVFTGVPGRKGRVSIEADLIMRDLVLKNQVVFGTVNAGRDAYDAAIRDLGIFAKRWPGPLHALITGRFPMNEYRELLLGKVDGIKNVIRID